VVGPPGRPGGAWSGGRFKGQQSVIAQNLRSIIVVPLVTKGIVIGAVYVDNPFRAAIFEEKDKEFLQAIADLATIAIDNARQYERSEFLLDGFVQACINAIEQGDPATAGHSVRVEKPTTGIAHAVSEIAVGKYRDVRLTEDQFTELRYACLLHDFGRLAVREYIQIKTKKLIPGKLELIQARFEAMQWSAQAKYANEKLEAMRNGKGSSQRLEDIDRRLGQEIEQLHMWMAAIVQANEPSVLPEDTASILEQLSKQTYHDLSGTPHPMLDPQEFRILSIRKGVLDPQERLEMESHVTHSFEFVNTIPWPLSMRRVPEIVLAHHEKLDGSGYARGLAGDQIPLQTRMLTIADIYDALTARDRPYKRAVPTATVLDILTFEAGEGKLDADPLDVFITKRVYEVTATR